MPSPSSPDLKAMQEQNRAALMDAITRRNDLHVEVERLEAKTALLEREAAEALRDGNRATAKLRLQAKVVAEQELTARRGELVSVESNVEDIKRSIRDTEELLRMQPPEAAKPQVVTVEETSSAVPLALRDTLDTLASGDNGQPLAAEPTPDPLPPVSPLSASGAEASPEEDMLLAARAQERGLTTEAYCALVMERALEVANMIMPAAAPLAIDQEDAQSLLIEEIINDATLEMQEREKASSDRLGRAMKQQGSLARQVANVTRLHSEAEQSARDALNRGERDLAQRMYRRMRLHEASLSVLTSLLTRAEENLAQERRQIQQHEERIRLRVVKSMLLRAHLTAAAIAFQQNAMPEETAPSEDGNEDFDAWVQSQRPVSPE